MDPTFLYKNLSTVTDKDGRIIIVLIRHTILFINKVILSCFMLRNYLKLPEKPPLSTLRTHVYCISVMI